MKRTLVILQVCLILGTLMLSCGPTTPPPTATPKPVTRAPYSPTKVAMPPSVTFTPARTTPLPLPIHTATPATAPPEDTLAAAKLALAQGDWASLTTFAKRLQADSENALIGSHMLMTAYLMQGRYNDNLRESIPFQKKRAVQGAQPSRFYVTMSSEFPSSVHVFVALGDAYLSEGNVANATKALERAREIDDKNPHVYSGLGVVKRQAGQVDQAIALYLKAIELDSKFAAAYLNLGAAYLFQKKFSEAERTLRKAVELRPDYAIAWANLGLACRNQGRLDEAISYYERAISLVPDYPSTYLNLGAAYHYKGDYERARQAWQKAVELDPDGPTGASARRNLSSLPSR